MRCAAENVTAFGVLCGSLEDDNVRNLLSQMQIATFEVDASSSESSAIRFKFAATRVWCGSAFLFLTVNPHDNKSPLLAVSVRCLRQ